MADEIKKEVKEKKSFKEKLSEVKSFIKEKKDVIIPMAIGGAGIVIGAIGHAIIDNAVNGGKTVAWYDYWDKDGHEDSMTYTKTPSIREIKRGGINGKISMITYDRKEFESVAEKENWDIQLRNEEK
jgi:hypothetical protein